MAENTKTVPAVAVKAQAPQVQSYAQMPANDPSPGRKDGTTWCGFDLTKLTRVAYQAYPKQAFPGFLLPLNPDDTRRPGIFEDGTFFDPSKESDGPAGRNRDGTPRHRHPRTGEPMRIVSRARIMPKQIDDKTEVNVAIPCADVMVDFSSPNATYAQPIIKHNVEDEKTVARGAALKFTPFYAIVAAADDKK